MDCAPMSNSVRWLLGLAGGLFLWHLPALTLTPGVNHDEVMLNAAARSWTDRGIIALPPLTDFERTYGEAYYWHPPGHMVLMAGAYRLFGFSIEVTRLVSLASGVSALVLLFGVVRRQNVSRAMAAVVVILFSGHPLVWSLCRSGRMDLFALSFGLGALLLFEGAEGEEISARRSITVGLLLGIGSLFHVLVLVWGPALMIAEVFRLRRIPWESGWRFGLAAGFPLAVWITTVFASGDGSAWMEQFVGYQLGHRTGAGPIWLRPFGEVILLARQLRFVPALVVVVFLGAFWGRGVWPVARRWAAGGTLAAFALVAFFTSKGTGVYPLYWFVWFLLFAAPGMAALPARVRGVLLALAIANAAAVQFGQVAVALFQRSARDPDRVGRFFRAHISRGDVVLGPEDIWYAVEHAGGQLRIWTKPDPKRHDFFVTYANVPKVAPNGFELVAELPDIMPKFLGYYWSHTANSYRLWKSRMK